MQLSGSARMEEACQSRPAADDYVQTLPGGLWLVQLRRALAAVLRVKAVID